MESIKTIVVEDVSLELKGTLSIIRNEIPEVEVIGTAQTEREFWTLIEGGAKPDLVLLDLGLGGSTTVGVDICRKLAEMGSCKVLVFTGELLNEKLWADVLDAGAHGIVLKTGELLTRTEVMDVMAGKRYVFNEPVLEKLVERFRKAVNDEKLHRSASIEYEIDEYDERFLRHLALGYTKDMISELRTMPFSSKSLEKRQADLVSRLFPEGEQRGVNVTRLVVRAIELHIIDPSNLEPDEVARMIKERFNLPGKSNTEMMNRMFLEEVREDELPLLLEMQVESFMPLYEKYHDECSPAIESIERIKARAAVPNRKYFFIVVDGARAGVINVGHNDPNEKEVSFISPLFILPKYWNQGIGYF